MSSRGKKRTCPSCDAKFYDLNRSPVFCPKCGAEIVINAEKPKVKKVVAEKPPKPEVSLEEDVVDDDDDGVLEDASDLGEDDDDLGEVMEHLESGEGDN